MFLGLVGKVCFLKGLICIIILSFSQTVYSQQKRSIEQRIADGICECFGAYGFEVLDQRINQAIDTCSNSVVKNYKAELEVYFVESKDADYRAGYQAGKLFYQQRVAPLLFKDCESLKKLVGQ